MGLNAYLSVECPITLVQISKNKMKVREVAVLHELALKYGTDTVLDTLTGIALGIVVTERSPVELLKYVNSLREQKETVFSILDGASNSSKECGEEAAQFWNNIREDLKEEEEVEEGGESEDVRHDIPKDDT